MASNGNSVDINESQGECSENDKSQSFEIKKAYRGLLDRTLLLQDAKDTGIRSVSEVQEVFEQADGMVLKTKTSEELVLDAQVVRVGTSVLMQNANSLDPNLRSFDERLFAKGVLQFLHFGNGHLEDQLVVQDDDEDDEDEPPNTDALPWANLASFGTICFRRVPHFSYLLGSLRLGEVQVAEQRAKKSRNKDDDLPNKKRPQQVESTTESDSVLVECVLETLKIMRETFKKNRNQPLDYLEFILDPTSFGNTVENIFHVSFMVKDGMVLMGTDEDGCPTVCPVTKSCAHTQLPQKESQTVISLDMNDWKELCQEVSRTRPIIKLTNRPGANQ